MTNVEMFFSLDTVQSATAFLLYAGPDQILPLISILGTLIGILLIWWRRAVALMRKAFRLLSRKRPAVESATPTEVDASTNLESPVKEQV